VLSDEYSGSHPHAVHPPNPHSLHRTDEQKGLVAGLDGDRCCWRMYYNRSYEEATSAVSDENLGLLAFVVFP